MECQVSHSVGCVQDKLPAHCTISLAHSRFIFGVFICFTQIIKEYFGSFKGRSSGLTAFALSLADPGLIPGHFVASLNTEPEVSP